MRYFGFNWVGGVIALCIVSGSILVCVAVVDLAPARTASPPPAARSTDLGAGEVEAAVAQTNLASRLAASLGESFGGVWFERSTAQLHVGVTSMESWEGAEEVARDAGLAEAVTETVVLSTWKELLSAQQRWNERLSDLFERGQVSTALSASRNAVVVELGSSVSPDRGAVLEREAAASGVSVAVDSVSEPYLRINAGARCNKFESVEANCDPTIVAGVTIDSEEGTKVSCSAGPSAILKDRSQKEAATKTYLLTAGHCIEWNGGEKATWFAYNKKGEGGNGSGKDLGVAGPFLNEKTDVGVIEVSTAYWATANDAIPVVPALAEWNPEAEVEPTVVENEVKTIAEGATTCFAGQRSGKRCGEIKATNVKKKFGEVEVEELVEVILDAGQTGGDGDSGAPFFTKESPGSVEGTFVGYTEKKPEEGNPVFFHPLKTSFERLSSEKGLDLELLTKSTEIRHPTFTAAKYPVTVSGEDTGSEDKFTVFGYTITCTEREADGTLAAPKTEEVADTLELTPTVGNCTDHNGLPVKVTMNGCKYKFALTKVVAKDHFGADLALACPSGKPGITFGIYGSHSAMTSETPSCDITLVPQEGLKGATLTNTAGKIAIDGGTIETLKAKIKRHTCGCLGSGVEGEEAKGVYHIDEPLTVAGSVGEEEVKIDMAGG